MEGYLTLVETPHNGGQKKKGSIQMAEKIIPQPDVYGTDTLQASYMLHRQHQITKQREQNLPHRLNKFLPSEKN